ncbi:hypothetical protein LP420_06570 [Massilia sp. B-10]|nr:hypothetical protein LP420_06570 [Massilia sp. B-10]
MAAHAHGRGHAGRMAGIEAVGVAVQGLAAVAHGAQQDLVVAEVGRLEDHFQSVRQRERGQTQARILRFADDGAGRGRRVHHAGGNGLVVALTVIFSAAANATSSCSLVGA